MSFSRGALADDIADRLESDNTKGLAEKIAAYLIEKGKTAEINSLERDIIQQRSEKNRIVELTAISAHELEQSQVQAIRRLVKKLYPECKEVIVNRAQDASVIGGIRLEFANQLLDLSAGAKLKELRRLTT